MAAFADADEKARARRPAGFVPAGPQPRGAAEDPELVPLAHEDLSYLSGDFRVFQHKRGHRWSLDDFITAVVAIEAFSERAPPDRFLDLGCGIGSVLMMMAWAFPRATGLGVEAQELSASMARRSLRYNGIDDRVQLRQHDLRELGANEPPFDLITGTPPYIPLGKGLVSERTQRGPAFFETRGGVEDYCQKAAELLAHGGVYVYCYGAEPEGRGERAALAAGLRVVKRVDVVPRAGKPTLLSVAVARRRGPSMPDIEAFVVRDADGRLTPQMLRARGVIGMPPPVPR